MTWICAHCATQHEENNPPCRNCGHEQFAKLDESQAIPSQIDPSDEIVWRCTECGRDHNRNNPPCNNCGGMSLETIRVVSESNQRQQTSSRSSSSSTYAPSGGLFRNYVVDAGHVQWWVWLITGLALFLLPGLGFFMLGAVAIGCIHKVDAAGEPLTPVNERPSGAWLIARAFGWAFAVLFAIGFLIGVVLVALA